ncbi:MAG: hypothetical protein AAGC68_10230 [Verrucomicrobiota bacterium]
MRAPRLLSWLCAIVSSPIWLISSTSAGPMYSTLESRKHPHVRVGISVRKIGVDFVTDPSRLAIPSAFRSVTTGPGDVGVYTGGPTRVDYEDGFVGIDRGDAFGISTTGDALTRINSASQFIDTNRPPPLGSAGFVDEVIFSSTSSTLDNTTSGRNLPVQSGSDDQTSIGPLVELVFPIFEEQLDPKAVVSSRRRFLNAVVGYSYHSTDHGTGPLFLGNQRLNQTDTNFTYTYDYFGGTADASSNYPFNGTSFSEGGIVWNAALYSQVLTIPGADFGPPEFLDPRTNETTSRSTTTIPVFLRTTIDVELHEIPFGLEYGRYFGESKIALIGGGTLNFVDLTATTTAEFFLPGSSTTAITQISDYSDQPVRLGAYLGLNLTHPLNDDGSIYVHAHATYRWVDGIQATVGATQVNLDLSSFEGGVGIGFILD